MAVVDPYGDAVAAPRLWAVTVSTGPSDATDTAATASLLDAAVMLRSSPSASLKTPSREICFVPRSLTMTMSSMAEFNNGLG